VAFLFDMRLDIFLVEQCAVKSRTLAKALVGEGKVLVNKIPAKKAGMEIGDDDVVELKEDAKYVSKDGYTLEKALNDFSIDVNDKVCLDVGISKGGFTDCLLQHGAKLVYGIDVLEHHLDDKLLNDERVINYDKVDARRLDDLIRTKLLSDFNPRPSVVVADLSSISLQLVLPAVVNCIEHNFEFIALVKPQFELSPDVINKKGIVADNRIRIKALKKIEAFCKSKNWKVKGTLQSPMRGAEGNVEYVIYFTNS
jgi:23S rRNA (cytidine1920-2'-O)/16S rRNA (cytidine1409-2'-O)-methyltransferase